MTYPILIAWGLAGAGSACAILAAYLQGGKIAALSAASGALLSAAGVVGWTGRAPPAAPVK